jgi:phenylpropionate dioxygenase-like ring-hydroxylating dioxygenase large terminal subunit
MSQGAQPAKEWRRTNPLKGLIPSTYYYDPALLSAEYEKLFGRTWNFVGFTFDLANNNDYISADVAGKPIVIQNFDGRLRAFLNVCSHRFSEIRCDPKGNSPLRCPYHGWTYDAEGLPTGIPSRPRFDGLTDDVIRSLALRRYRVEVCGALVFVTLDSTVPSLRDFMGEAWSTTESMSCSFGELIDRNELNLECNWKIAVENTLESYHVTFIHPKTFKILGASGTDFRFEQVHSSWRADVSGTIEKQMKKLEGIFESRPFKVNGYLHQLIFPSLTIATTFGHSFAVQQILPQSAGSTRFTSYVFATRLNAASDSTKNLRAMGNDSIVQFNRAVFEEDKTICEAVQRGIRNATGTGQLSDEELRVAHFQKSYSAFVSPLHSEAKA